MDQGLLTELETLFQEKGKVLDFRSGQSLFLEDREKVYLLKSGRGMIFSSVFHGQSLTGPRRHVADLEGLHVFFPIHRQPEKQSHGLFFVFEGGAEVFELDQKELQQNAEAYGEALNDWVETFSKILFSRSCPEPSVPLECARSKTLPGLSRVQGDRGHWVLVEGGQGTLHGGLDVDVDFSNSFLPLFSNMALSCGQEIAVSIQKTDVLTDEKQDILPSFHLFLAHMLELEEEKELKSAALKASLSEVDKDRQLDGALRSLTEVLSGISFETPPIQGQSALMAACELYGRLKGLDFNPQNQAQKSPDPEAEIKAIADRSRVRWRRVQIQDDWWKKSQDSFLAFYGPERKPVVLHWEGEGKGKLYIPGEAKPQRLSKEIAQEIHSLGYVFYPPLSGEKLKGREFFSWCFRGSYKDLIGILVLSLVVTLVGILPSFAYKYLFDTLIAQREIQPLIQLFVALTVLLLGSAGFSLVRSLLALRVEGLLENRVSAGLWDRVLNLPMSFFGQHSSGDLGSRLSLVRQVRQEVSSTVISSVLSGVFAVVYLFVMLYFSPFLTGVATIATLGGVFVSLITVGLLSRIYKELLEKGGKLNGTVIQLIGGVNKLRVAGAENRAFAFWANFYRKVLLLSRNSSIIGIGDSLVHGIINLLGTVTIFASVFYLLEGEEAFTIGTYIAFNSVYGPFSSSIAGLFSTVTQLINLLPSWERIKPLLEEKTESGQGKPSPGKLKGGLALNHVSYGYGEGKNVIKDLSLNVKPGEFVAIVGPSGSGKTTLLRLLLGFAQPKKGSVTYDGMDLAACDVREVRKQLGTVLQDGALLQGSLSDNVTMGGFYTQRQLYEVLEKAGFAHEVANMPMREHTLLSTGGVGLSGGQKQRLLIARALIPQPKILLLDEATSALDNLAQSHISENIRQLSVTRVVVAHRLSTIRGADRIIVLDNGEIVDEGKYEELISRPGIFQDIAKRQKI